MEHASPQARSRMWMLALSGVVAAFAWVILSVVLGFGAATAHADDSDGSGGLLDGVTAAVGDVAGGAVEAASDTVSQTVAAVAAAPVVAPVVPAAQPVVTAAQPVVAAAQPVVAAAQPVVAAVAEVAAPVQSGVVAPVVAPVVEIVAAVPVVGEVTGGLGVDTALNELAGTADGAVGAVIELPGRIVTAAPGIGLSESASASDRAAIAGAARAALETGASAVVAPAVTFRTLAASLTSAATVVAVAVVGGPAGSFPDLVSGMSPLASSISSPGGAGLGMGALLALGLFVAHRAWVRRNGLENDEAPPAPAFLTDVSPD